MRLASTIRGSHSPTTMSWRCPSGRTYSIRCATRAGFIDAPAPLSGSAAGGRVAPRASCSVGGSKNALIRDSSRSRTVAALFTCPMSIRGRPE